MATIDGVKRITNPDPNGDADYVVTVEPSAGRPGHGVVEDQNGHSAPWSSPAGDPVDVLIHGSPPFRAVQLTMIASAWVGP